jgi:hypothetical protein
MACQWPQRRQSGGGTGNATTKAQRCHEVRRSLRGTSASPFGQSSDPLSSAQRRAGPNLRTDRTEGLEHRGRSCKVAACHTHPSNKRRLPRFRWFARLCGRRGTCVEHNIPLVPLAASGGRPWKSNHQRTVLRVRAAWLSDVEPGAEYGGGRRANVCNRRWKCHRPNA